MTTEARRDALFPLLELLVGAGDPGLCERLFLEAVLASGAARGAGLWRRTADGSWSAILARGDPVLLPSKPVVEAVAHGRLRSELLPDRRVLVAREAGLALALGGLSTHEEDLDAAEALLLALVAVTSAFPPGEMWVAPLPSNAPSNALSNALSRPLASPEASGEARRLQHDLRNMLTSIRTTRDVLHSFGAELPAEEAEHFQAVLDRECRRIGELVGRTAGSREPKECAVLGVVVRDVLDAERVALSALRVELVSRIDPAVALLHVRLPEADLSRLVRNLIVNAGEVLARERGGSIAVALDREPAGRVSLRVSDDGPGILPEALERVFEPGYTTGKLRGTGQGLAIVAELARAAGGSVRAANREHGGAEFEVLLPTVPDPDHGSLPSRGTVI